MNREQIFEKVKIILSDSLNIPVEEITEEKTLIDLGADSLDAVNSIMEIEKGFNIAMADKEAEEIKTVKDIINLIESHTKTA